MRNKLKSFTVCVFFLLIFSALADAQTRGLNNPSVNARTYLPGDFVHVVVEAPVDTAQITATLPDGTLVSLVQDRRSNVWRGIWQVPVDFKKGAYSAKLSAIDVQGNLFEGQTDGFTVGELALITLTSKPTGETAAETTPLKQVIIAEPPIAGVSGQDELLKLIKKIVTPTTIAPTPGLTSETKKQLIASNLAAGKVDLRQEKFSEAAAYFRVVLYLAPDNQEAAKLLADATQQIEKRKTIQIESRRRLVFIVTAATLTFLIALAGLIYLLMRVLPKRTPIQPAASVEKSPLSEKEKEALWFKNIGWKKKPFDTDVVKQLFSGISKLELDGLKNFIKARIEEAGGNGTEPFSDSAIEKVFELSKGDPGTALKICDWAVNQSITHDLFSITAEIIRQYAMNKPGIILISDDEEIIRSSLDAILRKGGGYRTDFAADGEEALSKIKNNVYSCVLLDIEMPKLDGYEILKQVRSVYPDLPVIFVTGKGIPQKTIESMAKYNLTGYIEKPFTPEKVLDLVARAINK